MALAGSQPDARREAELNLLEKEGVSFDLFCDELRGYEEQAIPLDGLLEIYGQGILSAVGPRLLDDLRGTGTIYTLPSVSDYVTSEGISMRKDIVDKYQIDLSQIRSAADLGTLFATVRQYEPQLGLVCGYYSRGAVLGFEINAQRARDSVFALDGDGRLVNYFATQQFQSMVELVRSWYLDGYVHTGMSLQNTEASALVQAGELFSYITAYKPGIEQEVSVNCGMEMITIPLMEPVVSNRSSTMRYWGITQSCKNPGKAMQFLNLLYSDSEVVNLLSYGVEGVHHVRYDSGVIGYPQGVTAQTVGYVNTMPWLLPNQLISLVWETYDADLWLQLDQYNRSAQRTDLTGFFFDSSAVAEQNQALNQIVNEYYYGLTSGQLDPAIYLPLMLERMQGAGLDAVLAEAQRQYDEWLAAREGIS